MSVAKRISGDKALIYSDYKNKENKESEVPGSKIAIQSANCYCGSSFLPEGTGKGGGALLGTSTSKTETPLVLHWLLLNKNNILFHSLIIIISSTNKT